VREAGNYSTRHNIDVLLNVCNKDELADSYDLLHTFLSRKRAQERKSPDPGDPGAGPDQD